MMVFVHLLFRIERFTDHLAVFDSGACLRPGWLVPRSQVLVLWFPVEGPSVDDESAIWISSLAWSPLPCIRGHLCAAKVWARIRQHNVGVRPQTWTVDTVRSPSMLCVRRADK